MASENVEDWNLPLPTPENISEYTDELTQRERQHEENLELRNYVESMACRQYETRKASQHIESISKPKKRTLGDNVKQFAKIMVPSERTNRLKRLADKHNTITTEQLEKIIRPVKAKERQKVDILKRKEEIYYELLTKVELQSRAQYLNQVLKKFADFVAELSTTMRVSPTLFDPYARMQKAILCKILQSIGVEYSEYAVCHKLSHVLLSIIIKALDLASTRNLDDEAVQLQTNFKMDNDIKDRLMRAAKRKILTTKRKQF